MSTWRSTSPPKANAGSRPRSGSSRRRRVHARGHCTAAPFTRWSRERFETNLAAVLEVFALFDALDDARGRSECMLDAVYAYRGQRRHADAVEAAERAVDWGRRAGDAITLGNARPARSWWRRRSLRR